MRVEVVREVTDDVQAALARLLPQLNPNLPVPDLARLQRLVTDPAVTLLVAKDGEEIVGTTTVIVYTTPFWIKARLDEVVVDANTRGMGVGEALVKGALAISRQKGAQVAELQSGRGDARKAAHRLYERLGFKIRETDVMRIVLYNGNRLDRMSVVVTEVEQRDIEEARAFNAQLEALIATQPLVTTLPAPVTRKARREGKGIFPAPVFLEEATELEVAGRAGAIKVRVIRPDKAPTGIYLHIHGGGWTLGGHDMQDAALKWFANETGLCMASIDYRLAPEHPYPAAPDDCEDAVLHLLEHGPSLLDAPARFAIGGESAGGHLSVVTLLRLRDRHGINDGITAANLVFGAYDMNGTPSTLLWGDRNLVLSVPIIRWFTDNFLPDLTFEQRREPDISPLYARLQNMPRALFTVGTLDPLLDDTLFMSERWRSAGNQAEVALYPEAVHGFTAYPIGVARAANVRQARFLREALG